MSCKRYVHAYVHVHVHVVGSNCIILYSQTSQQRTLWDQYELCCCILLSKVDRKPIIWDIEECPLLRGVYDSVSLSRSVHYRRFYCFVHVLFNHTHADLSLSVY